MATEVAVPTGVVTVTLPVAPLPTTPVMTESFKTVKELAFTVPN